MVATEREQELVNIMFQIAMTVRDSDVLQKMDNEQLAEWVRNQLSACGFETEPVGASWGVLR